MWRARGLVDELLSARRALLVQLDDVEPVRALEDAAYLARLERRDDVGEYRRQAAVCAPAEAAALECVRGVE
jgi:hypothetical protein